MNDLEFVQATSGLINQYGSAFYFAPATLAKGEELGLDTFGFYALGRGGVLGDVEPAVVSAAFGYFNPSLVAHLWNKGKAIVAPRVAGAAYVECCAEHGRSVFTGVEGLDAFVAAGEKVLAACEVEAFPLFAAIAAEPAATDVAGRAMQLLAVLREYRGCAHLVALRAVGVRSKDAHFVKRPNDVKMFGWAETDAPVIDDALLGRMAEAEALTDRIVLPAFAVLDQAERAAMVAGLAAVGAALAG
ncbi:MAG TPA: hypothetical protein DCR14_00910 [Acidimicrobiaceae bacterium]|nr:hypothetical protein [Acidimicrobiaceae bacterium]